MLQQLTKMIEMELNDFPVGLYRRARCDFSVVKKIVELIMEDIRRSFSTLITLNKTEIRLEKTSLKLLAPSFLFMPIRYIQNLERILQ